MVEPPPQPEHTTLQSGSEVLISGASFAGLATAFWMLRLGHRVTIVEVAPGLRRGGTPVDIEGETIGILRRMGLFDAVRAKALPPRGFEFRSADDEALGGMPAHPDAAETRFEIHRDDLLDILSGEILGKAEIAFGRSMRSLTNGSDTVSVVFDDGSARDYALVFGCDGNRSNTRRLAFEDGASASHFMGAYVFLKVVPVTSLLPADVSQVFSVAGRTAMLNGYDDRTDICLAFRSEDEIEYNYRDRAQQRRMVHGHFDGLGWKVPAMLAHLDEGNDFYFDRVNQIRMPSWSRGRVALVGDAGYCVSPVAGMGGSMALIGAARLAEAMERHGDDHASAFREYHAGLHGFVEEVQERAVTSGMSIMFPADEDELAERDRMLGAGTLEL